MHCSGKVLPLKDTSTKSCDLAPQEIVLLHCHPFMLAGSDINNELQQNVFWSKHEMDLTIKEVDKV